MRVIDADAHVVESERTWEFLDEAGLAPRVMVLKDHYQESPARGSSDEYWMINGRVFAKGRNIGHDTSRESREMEDVKARLAHMDKLQVDVQVLYPSLFLRALTVLPHVYTALCRSYNRWLAEIWKQGDGRLRWVVIPPLEYIDKALEELCRGGD